MNPRHKDFQSSALPTELPSHWFTCKELLITPVASTVVLIVYRTRSPQHKSKRNRLFHFVNSSAETTRRYLISASEECAPECAAFETQVELYANVGARRWCELRSTAQSEVDRSHGVCGTSFEMNASLTGRKKIAHRCIGGSWCENRMSPFRDDNRANHTMKAPKSGAKDTRTPNASRVLKATEFREASGLRRVHRRFWPFGCWWSKPQFTASRSKGVSAGTEEVNWSGLDQWKENGKVSITAEEVAAG